MAAYSKALNSFRHFASSHLLPSSFPISDDTICLYITHLHNLGHPGSSISSILSGINYFSKLSGCRGLLESFKTQQLLKSLRDLDTPDNREPITTSILSAMINNLQESYPAYDCSLLRCTFILAHTFALRLSEFSKSPHNLQLHQIVINGHQLSVKFSSFKHTKSYPLTHTVSENPNSNLCAVKAARIYLSRRGNEPGPFFIRYGQPLTSYFVNNELKKSLQSCGINPTNFSSHSFRIGAASTWAENGLSESQLKARGRWSSDALKHYIRGSVNHSAS